MADTDTDETTFCKCKVGYSKWKKWHWQLFTGNKGQEKCWRISTLKKREVLYNTKMRTRDSKNTHFTVSKEKQKNNRESRPIRTEAAVTKMEHSTMIWALKGND